MQPRLAVKTLLDVNRLLGERVGEAVAPAWSVVDEPCPVGFVERFGQGLVGELTRLLQDLDRELPADGGCDFEHLGTARREVLETAADHLAHPRRHLQNARGGIHRPAHSISPGEQVHQLTNEEGIAVRPLEDLRYQVLRWIDAREPLHELSDLVGSETFQGNARAQIVSGQLREAPRQRMIAIHLHVSIAADEQNPCRRDLVRQEFEQLKRGRAGPVEIFDDQDPRLARRGAREEARDGIEEAEACLLGVGLGGRFGEIGQALADRRNDPGDACGSVPQVDPQGVGTPPVDDSAHDLHPRPIGRDPLILATPGRVYRKAFRAGAGGELLGGPRLADTGLSGQEDDSPSPSECVFEGGIELIEDGTSAHEVGRSHRARAWAYGGRPLADGRDQAIAPTLERLNHTLL